MKKGRDYMSYAIVRIQKFASGAVGGIQIHDKRKKEGISHTNKDIDWEKTKENYDLAENQKNYHKTIKSRIESLDFKKAVRKDAVVMAQCLVTSDRDFFNNLSQQDIRKFFEESYNWLCERYGKDNVISATVHMDEKTPHMHFNFVPVTADGRLSAKSLFTAKSLREQHDLFYKDIGKRYGLDRGQEGGSKKHLDVLDYKIKTKADELDQLAQTTVVLQKKEERLRKELDSLQTVFKNAADIHALRPKKTLTGIKGITIDQIENLKNIAYQYFDLQQKIQQLEKENNKLRTQNSKFMESYSQYQKNFEKLNRIMKVLSTSPELEKEIHKRERELKKGQAKKRVGRDVQR